jgi:MOSC domain-containing protein YiiM
MTQARIASVHIGEIAPLGPNGEPSAFVKHALAQPVEVNTLGLVGDQQADLRVHGGEEKAVYAYGIDHYAAWAADHPQHAALFVPGSLGENLAISGMVEADICVGDVHQIGSTQLQVCQPRQPCFKFALRFNDKYLPKAMVRNGRSGWYYRVLRTGVIAPGDSVTLVDRPNPGFSFMRLVALISASRATAEEIEQLAVMPGLASNWQAMARQMLNDHG